MFYIDSNMLTNASQISGDFSNAEQTAKTLKAILIDGSVIARPDRINVDIFVFNNGFKVINGLGIVEVSDGVKSINVKLTQIDGNTLKSDKIIEGFNSDNIVIKTPKAEGWEYEETETEYIFRNMGATFEITKTQGTVFKTTVKRLLSSVTGDSLLQGSDRFFYILYSDKGFFLSYAYTTASTPAGVMSFYNSESITNALFYRSNINWTARNTGILTIDGIAKSSIANDYTATNASGTFSESGGPVSFFKLTAQGHHSDLFLNVSGNVSRSLAGNQDNMMSSVVLFEQQGVILVTNRNYFMGLAYDNSVY